MNENKETLNTLVKEIKTLIEDNENKDGTYHFDVVKAIVALDFAKTEIEKTISD